MQVSVGGCEQTVQGAQCEEVGRSQGKHKRQGQVGRPMLEPRPTSSRELRPHGRCSQHPTHLGSGHGAAVAAQQQCVEQLGIDVAGESRERGRQTKGVTGD